MPEAKDQSCSGPAPLRLLLVTQHFWPESFRINSFVEVLRDAGADVTVLTGQPNYPEGRSFSGYRWWSAGCERYVAGYEIIRVPLIPRGKASHVRLALNYISFVVMGGLFGPWLLRGRKFDAILVYGTSPIFQAFAAWPLRLFKRAPVAVWVQDLWPNVLTATGYVQSGSALKLVEHAVAYLYRHTELLLCQSQAFVDAIRPLAGKTPVEYLPNPGEPASAVVAPAAVPLFEDRFAVVFAGNLGRAQALEDVVRSAELLRQRDDIAIWLFGSGALQNRLAAMIASARLTNIHLPGRVAPEQMGGILARADAALLTLVDDPMVAKTVPSKLQSYFAAGVPVIVGAGGEAARITRAANAGIVAAPCDPTALAHAIEAMADLPAAERSAMGERAARYYAEHFDSAVLASGLVKRLRRLAADKRSETTG